ncbi:unnamed protein product [Moneuplotes crassus]|uniref:Uncharacterized protein n=1 Tax=Euplotes crassus TaxID=5936 RepID=A0AAD2CYQ1_EUPCR|nr:unnamed protein product [Moneuplotes crassus]
MMYKFENHMDIPQIEAFATLEGHTNSIDAVKVDPTGGKKFISGSHDRTIKIWDLNTLKCIKTTSEDSKGIWCLDYSPSGKEILSSSGSGVCKIWDAKTGKATEKLSAHKGSTYWGAYSESGNLMVTGGFDKTIYVWSRKKTSKPALKLIGNQSKVRCVGFFNDDKYILSTSQGGEITIFDAKTGDIVSQQIFFGEREELEGNISYCGRAMRKIGGGCQFMTTHQDCVARSWEFSPDDKEFKQLDTFIGHSDTVRYVDFSPSESRCVTACEDHSLRVWDMESQKGEYLLAGHHDFASAADFVNDNILISSSWDQTLKIWKLNE